MTGYVRQVWRGTLALLALWALGSGLLAVLICYTGMSDDAYPSDVIIVLGAALSDDGTPYKALTRRSEHAAQLWKRRLSPSIICTGGVGRRVRVRRSEADGCREVLMRNGVPASAIVLEEASRSTEENARNARGIMQQHGWHSAIVVSDSYHVFRARLIVRRAGMTAVTSPVPTAKVGSPLFYAFSVVREVMAMQWLLVRG